MKLTSAVTMIGVGLSVGLFINTYPEWTAWQLAKFVVALFVGIIVGVWVNSQIFFPILYGLPKSVWLFFKGELRFVGILVQFVAPILWMTLAFIVGFVAPSFAHFVSTNLGLALGNTISVVVVLLSLVTPSGLRDLRSDFDEKTYARFRKNQQDQMEEIRSKARAWRETVNKEMETTNVLLSQCVYKFREGYGLNGQVLCDYAAVLASASLENLDSRSELELPSTFDEIKDAIVAVAELAIIRGEHDTTIDLLRMLYSSLARFLPDSQARLMSARNMAWLAEDPNHPALTQSEEASRVDAKVEAEEDRLEREFETILLEKKQHGLQTEIEWWENEKAKILREKTKIELELTKSLFNLRPDDPDAVIEDILQGFRKSDVKEGTSVKYCGDALIAWRQGDRESAFDLYTKAIELDSDDAVTLLNRGNLQLEMGRFEAGITDIERAREIAPELPCDNADIFKMLPAEQREAVRQRIVNEKKKSERSAT